MSTSEPLKQFLTIPYDQLETLNLEAKQRVKDEVKDPDLKEYYIEYLKNENGIKAVTLCFADIEGRFHMLDYDKKFLLKNNTNLTFDGSSIRGFSNVADSDLRLEPDWGSFRWLPADIFGAGKVIMFANILDQDGTPYPSDFRSVLKAYIRELKDRKNITTNIAVECEGFLLDGINAEQEFISQKGFQLVSTGGYYNSLPKDRLKLFIDEFAEAQRAMGFENEKDHPEVAPSQFELNYRYCDAVTAADQLLLYKLLARQIAASSGMTASFLPKPIMGINGSGMHCNVSLSQDGKNLFYGGEKGVLTSLAEDFIARILHSANDMCLVLNSSVNAYRRLDPAFEAPNQIKYSVTDRTSMIRIPLGNEDSARIEVRSVGPDANPYMVFYTLLRVGLEGPMDTPDEAKRPRTRFLPANIQDAIKHFKGSEVMTLFLGESTGGKFIARKRISANRCPKELGTQVKSGEILFHHEITNQSIWSRF